MMFTAWTLGMVVMFGGFGFQSQVLGSPRVSTGPYNHPVEYKGALFYLDLQTFRIWSLFEAAVFPTWALAASLMFAYAQIEDRLKVRRRQSELNAVFDNFEREQARHS